MSRVGLPKRVKYPIRMECRQLQFNSISSSIPAVPILPQQAVPLWYYYSFRRLSFLYTGTTHYWNSAVVPSIVILRQYSCCGTIPRCHNSNVMIVSYVLKCQYWRGKDWVMGSIRATIRGARPRFQGHYSSVRFRHVGFPGRTERSWTMFGVE